MYKTIIIAEIGPNHNGNFKLAKKYVDEIKKSGADYIKFQTSIPADHISKFASKAKYQKINTKNENENQLDMAKKISLSHKEFIKLNKYCKKKKINFITTAFGIDSLKFIKKLNMNFVKVPSGEIDNILYLNNLPTTKKILLSTGMSNLKEISFAVNFLLKRGVLRKNIIIMQCTSAYPTPYNQTNLNFIKTLKKKFKTKVGFSDHTIGPECAIASIGFGAEVIEKHVTFNNMMKGPDHKTSIQISEFKKMVKKIRNVDKAIGNGIKKLEKNEKGNKAISRNSVVAKKKIFKNELFSTTNLTIKRPGTGLPTKYFFKLIGKKSKKKYMEDELIKKSEIN